MKKLLLVASVAAAISLINTASAATNGTVTFSGKLNDQTCQVVLNNGTSSNGTVTMPAVSKDNIPAKYSTAGITPFTLNLKDCKASTTPFGILAYFPPTTYTQLIGNWGFLKNLETGSEAASGVYLSIYQKVGATEKRVNVGTLITDPSYQYTTVAANATTATLEYSVRYMNYSSGAIKAGKVRGIAVYELAYQ